MNYISADLLFAGTGEALKHKVLAINDDNSIFAVLDTNDPSIRNAEITYYKGALCPGFVNTHCHLELSWAKGLIQQDKGLDQFIRTLQSLKSTISAEAKSKSIENALAEMHNSGIAAYADISNTSDTILAKSTSSIICHTFIEIFGSNPALAQITMAEAVKLKNRFESQQSFPVSITPHATYSLSSELMALIGLESRQILSIHHQENEDENAFFETGTGILAERRKKFNSDIAPFEATGKRPMESIADNFDKSAKLLLVHNTVSKKEDIDFIERNFENAFWCLCPNANLYIENRLPDVELLWRSKLKITLGTDSLASNKSLSILSEIQSIQSHFPTIPLHEILQWATYNGAEFLGIQTKAGLFAKNRKPGVVLLKNINLEPFALTPESCAEVLIPPQL